MNAAYLLLGTTGCFLLAYFFYSKLIARLIGVKPGRPTPAHTCRDGVDYVPAHPAVLFGHHFASIAGAGPIVGPILAAEFGWAAVTLWVVIGCIFIGSVHDMATLYLSVRNKGRGIATVIERVLGAPGKFIFLFFCWSTLLLVCAEFTRLVAATFTKNPAVATASLLFIAEAVVFGLCVYRFRAPLWLASIVFVSIMFASVWVGDKLPFDLCAAFGLSETSAQTVWTLVLLAYCFLASTLPVWLLLQPRDYLNSYLLYAMMALGFAGVFFAHPSIQAPAFTGWAVAHGEHTHMLFPFLFVTIACGACSGFHALVASGTTAKQLDSERHIRPVAYGGMLLEGVLAILSLIAVAALSRADFAEAMKAPDPVALFASGIAGLCTTIGLSFKFANVFISLAVAAFLMTSVDTATRLARFTWQEMFLPAGGAADATRKTGPVAKVCSNLYFATGLSVALIAALLLGNPETAENLWHIFASSNQLLAALTLLTASLWLVKRRRPCAFTAIPMIFMFAASGWALLQLTRASTGVLRAACVILFCMALALLALAAGQHKIWLRRK